MRRRSSQGQRCEGALRRFLKRFHSEEFNHAFDDESIVLCCLLNLLVLFDSKRSKERRIKAVEDEKRDTKRGAKKVNYLLRIDEGRKQ